MTDFIREVDEDVRQDKLRRLFQRFWPLAILLAALVLVGVGAWEGYRYLRTEKEQASGGRYLDALDLARDNKPDAAKAALEALATDGAGGYRVLARMRLAALVGTTDKAAGAKAFDAIAADANTDPAIANVARLRAAMLVLDTGSFAEVKARIEPLADANSAVRNPAREMLALAALKADDVAAAGRYLDAIDADPTATGQMRQRVAALQGLVRGAGTAPAPPPVAEASPPAPAPAQAAAPAQEQVPAPAASPAVPPRSPPAQSANPGAAPAPAPEASPQ